MKQPFATLTNLIYVAVGIYWFSYAPVLGLALIALGIGSGWYHGTGNEIGLMADRIGMYLVTSAFLGIILAKLIGPDIGYAMALAVFVGLGTGVQDLNSRHALVVMALPLLVGLYAFVSLAAVGQVLGLILLGLILRDIGDKRYGGPYSHDWRHNVLHGTWHLLTGTAFWLLARYLLV